MATVDESEAESWLSKLKLAKLKLAKLGGRGCLYVVDYKLWLTRLLAYLIVSVVLVDQNLVSVQLDIG